MSYALGSPADALASVQEAITIIRELAQANPGRYRPVLVYCLGNLADVLSALGLDAEADDARSEARMIRDDS